MSKQKYDDEESKIEKIKDKIEDKCSDIEKKLEKTFASKYADRMKKLNDDLEDKLPEVAEEYKKKYAKKSTISLKMIRSHNCRKDNRYTRINDAASYLAGEWVPPLELIKVASLVLGAFWLGVGVPLLIKDSSVRQSLQEEAFMDTSANSIVETFGGADKFSKIFGGINTGFGAAATLFFVGSSRKIAEKVYNSTIRKEKKTLAKLEATTDLLAERGHHYM